jgi:hypothetical protein
MIVVHIAGEMIGGVQRCSRCGVVLIDYMGAAVAVMPGNKPPTWSGWPENGFVSVDGNQSAVTPNDARFIEERACTESVQ